MRYFTKELWIKINDSDEAVRTQAQKEWNENGLRYQREFKEIQKHISGQFINEYLCRNGLHDYNILCLAITGTEREYSCQLQLTDGAETVLITIAGLKAFRIDATSLQYCIQGKLEWGYGEFEITPENNIKLSVLCDIQNEMEFEFESIKIQKQ